MLTQVLYFAARTLSETFLQTEFALLECYSCTAGCGLEFLHGYLNQLLLSKHYEASRCSLDMKLTKFFDFQQLALFAWPYKHIHYCKGYLNFENQNYIIGQLRYFDNNLSRTSKQAPQAELYELHIAKLIRRVHQFIDQNVYG